MCEWRDIKGYEGRYQISDTGLVRSIVYVQTRKCIKERILKPWKRSKYYLVDLWKDGVRDIRSVHRLVYEAFIGDVPSDKQIHHKDCNKLNNSKENLILMTPQEHAAHHLCGKKPWNFGLHTGNQYTRRRQ